MRTDHPRLCGANCTSRTFGQFDAPEFITAGASRSATNALFDEGEALFGKRSEVWGAHDRCANFDVSYLL